MLQNSMRRKTVELDRNLQFHGRKGNKKASIQLKNKTTLETSSQCRYQFMNNLCFADSVSSMIIEELLDSLEVKFRQFDEKQFDNLLQSKVASSEKMLFDSMNPLAIESLQDERSPNAQEEPSTIITDWICGGKLFHCEKKTKQQHSKNPSITESDRTSKNQDGTTSKKVLPSCRSSKLFMRFPKEQLMECKRTLEPLKMKTQESIDRHQDYYRQRVLRSTVGLGAYGPLSRSGTANLPDRLDKSTRPAFMTHGSSEVSYDYDGSAILLNKVTRRNFKKVNILNTTCRVAKDTAIFKHGCPKKSLPYNVCKTEVEDYIKENTGGEQQGLHKLIEARKQSAQLSSNNLKFLPSRDDEQIYFRSKFEELARNKAVKIREIRVD